MCSVCECCRRFCVTAVAAVAATCFAWLFVSWPVSCLVSVSVTVFGAVASFGAGSQVPKTATAAADDEFCFCIVRCID